MATYYNYKVGDTDASGRTVTSVSKDSAGNVIGYGTTSNPSKASNTAGASASASSGSSGGSAVLANANKVVTPPIVSSPSSVSTYVPSLGYSVNDYSASADKSSAEYNNPNNWIGGVVGQGVYTYDPNIERSVANEKLYADTNGEQGYWTPKAEAGIEYNNGTYTRLDLTPGTSITGGSLNGVLDSFGVQAVNDQLKAGNTYAAQTAPTAAQSVSAAEAASVKELADRVNLPMPDLNSISVTDYSEFLRELAAATEQLRLAKLKAAVEGQVSGYEQQIGALPGEYDPLRNQAEVNRFGSERMLNENLANTGLSNSGTGRSERLALDTAYNNELTNLNKSEQDAVNKLRDLINQTNAAATQEELAIQGEVGAQLSQDLYNEKIRADQARQDIYNQQMSNWQWGQEYNANLAAQEQSAALQKQQLALQIQEAQSAAQMQEKENYRNYELPKYSADYQAEINRLAASSDPGKDWKIALLNEARDAKVLYQNQTSAEMTQQEFDNWYKLQQLYGSGSGSGSGSGDMGTGSQLLTALKSGVATPEIIAAYDSIYGAGAANQVIAAQSVSQSSANDLLASGDRSAESIASANHFSEYQMDLVYDTVKNTIEYQKPDPLKGQYLSTIPTEESVAKAAAYLTDLVSRAKITNAEAKEILSKSTHGLY